MIITLLITVAAAATSIWLFAAQAPANSVAQEISPAPLATVVPTPPVRPAGSEAAVHDTVSTVTLQRASEPTPTPAQKFAPTAAASSEATTPAAVVDEDACDGKEVHITETDSDQVQVNIRCDKKSETGSSISNSVNIDAKSRGDSTSGDVTVDVDVKISNTGEENRN